MMRLVIATLLLTPMLPPVLAAGSVAMTPAGGTFAGAVDVTLSATAGASIYYTLDGSTPTVNTTLYTAPIHLTGSGWVRAIAVQSGTFLASVENFFSIQALTAPSISPNGGTFTTCPDVTLSAVTGASIYYTLDGTQPSQSSALYSQPIHLTSSVLLSAKAFAGGLASGTVQASFTVNCSSSGPLAAPGMTPAGGTFTSSVDVTLTATTGATIYYTLDGSTPGTNTLIYASPIHLTSSAWVRAIAVKSGSPNSTVTERFFNILAAGPPPPPTISPNGGTFTTCPDVTLSSVTGAAIYYTLDGSVPSTASSLYSSPLHLTQNAIITALASLNGLNGATAQASFTVNCGSGTQVTAVTMTPGGGVFSGSVTITLATATTGAAIYYTTDGSTPSPAALLYSAPIKLTQSGWIRAIATRPGYVTSTFTENFFTIVATPTPSAPVITPNGGSFTTCPDVTLSTTSSGASVFYTLDGTTPTQSSNAYLQPIHLTQNTVLSARAFSGSLSSSVTTATFSINCTQSAPPLAPTVSPAGGTFTGSVDVTLTGAAGTTVYYTLDGSTPSSGSTRYSAPVHLTHSGWIRAVAINTANAVSPAAEFYFVIVATPQPPAAPVITPNGGTFNSCPDITLSSPTAGAAIYYTLDGTTPSSASAAYTTPIHLTASTTIKAAAFLSATVSSSVSQASFVVNCQPAQPPSPPALSPDGGTFTTSVDVTMTSTAGAAIYYTLDGTTPSGSSRLYTAAVHLTQSGWIRTIAILNGLTSGLTERFFSITTVVTTPLALQSLSCAPTSVSPPAPVTCTVTLNQAAPSATAVTLSSSNTTALTVPGSVSVPAGASSAGFSASSLAVSSNQNAVITASYGGVSKTSSVTVVASTPTGGLNVSVATSSGNLTRYDVYEITMTSTATFANPWEDPSITATFAAPSGATYSVGGFYYDTNTWKLRFAPVEAGVWTWSLTFSNGSSSFNTTGSLSVATGTNSGFLRIHPSNPRRFLTEGNNSPYFPMGFNDCIGDWTGPAGVPDGLLDWSLDVSATAVSTDTYFNAHSAAGENIFRHGPGNCSDILYDSSRFNYNNTGKNFYQIDKGKYADQLVTKLHAVGMKYFLTILPTPTDMVPAFDLSDPVKQQALLNYHKYVINRYGAYVDIWELMNEQYSVPGNYYNTVGAFIRSYDPYKHPITTSFYDNPVAGVSLIEIDSPHVYFGVNNLVLDDQMVNGTYGFLAYKNKFPSQPLLLGESGNIGPISNYDPERYRMGIWTAMMNETGIIYWNSSFTKYPAGTSGLTNMYIGPEERGMARVLADYSNGFDVNARPVPVTVNNTAIHAYVLQSASQVGGYFVNSASHSTSTSGVTVTLTVPSSGLQGQWIDPKTGTVLQSFTPAVGAQTLAIPTFICDIVLRIR